MENKFTDHKIDEVMHSIDYINRASPRPFLFTRLEAKLKDEKNIWFKLSSLVARPVVALACICFVLVVNAIVIFLVNNSGNSLAQQSSELAAADEYSLVSSSSLYEFENPKP